MGEAAVSNPFAAVLVVAAVVNNKFVLFVFVLLVCDPAPVFAELVLFTEQLRRAVVGEPAPSAFDEVVDEEEDIMAAARAAA